MKLLRFILVILAALAWGTGCGHETRVSDEAERDHPAMKKARELENGGDLEGARFIYQSLLDRDPSIARANLALAFLLEKSGGNSIDALYHFKRYLLLRPDTEKRGMIETHMRAVQLDYVAGTFSNEVAILHRMGDVERENASLKIRVTNLTSQTTQLRAALAVNRGEHVVSNGPAAQLLEHIRQPVPVPRPAAKTVRVEKGDNLGKIAVRFYGEQGRWREIYEANRQQLRRPEDIQVGQVLVIPERSAK